MPFLSGAEGGNTPTPCWLQSGWGVPGGQWEEVLFHVLPPAWPPYNLASFPWWAQQDGSTVDPALPVASPAWGACLPEDPGTPQLPGWAPRVPSSPTHSSFPRWVSPHQGSSTSRTRDPGNWKPAKLSSCPVVPELQEVLGRREPQVLKGHLDHQARWAPRVSQVFQRRQDGSVDFFRSWSSYRAGFGNQESEFWLGNENLHQLTLQGNWELRVELEDFNGNCTFAHYATFRLLGEVDHYQLALGKFSEGTADSWNGTSGRIPDP
ncbi:ficolin-3 isoform X5 [Pan troglodytes]|uniref:ficolin-3 isoform X5 n=1 Tax=Pan troglodytes TaxID=9598 RepID=UPI000D0A305D|nr:ficolin-3 isoform X5 [Pan troglodytes]